MPKAPHTVKGLDDTFLKPHPNNSRLLYNIPGIAP